LGKNLVLRGLAAPSAQRATGGHNNAFCGVKMQAAAPLFCATARTYILSILMIKKHFYPMNTGVSSYKNNSVWFSFSSSAVQLARRVGAGLAILYLTACSTSNAYYDSTKAHHTPQGFQNNYSTNAANSFGDFWRWQWARLRAGLPPAPQTPTPTVKADTTFIQTNALAQAAMQPAVTWIGHATVLVQASGLNVLTDPIFSERASMVQFAGPRRRQPPGLSLDGLPPIDVVIISHNHYDHLDVNSVRYLANRAQDAGNGAATLFIVPLGLKVWMENLGIRNVRELDWWQSVTVKGVEFQLTPVQHWSARGVADRSHTLWGGYAVLGSDFHWYFAGDTGFSADFADTRARLATRQSATQGGGFDLALIPIGAYEPRWFMQQQHVNPLESVQMHQALGAKRSMGMHWGTFELTDEPLDQAPQDLAVARRAQAVADDDFFLLAIGQTRKLPRR
jgi:N-acyl-phosphatidylethanolamine-hydrolysing phospholipase D